MRYVLQVVQIFGYTGDRDEALKTLYSIGGWNHTSEEPEIGPDEEGIRRPLADITLLIFHLLLGNYTYRGIDLGMVCPTCLLN